MKSSRLGRTLLIILLLAVNIGCDQGTKAIIRHKFEYYDWVGYLHNHITITRVENSGAFLSLGDNLKGPLRNVLLNILPLLAVLFGLYYIFTKTDLNRVTLVGIILIVGGGIGNIYDRIMHGSVTDFLHINFVIFQTGIFNVADMSIMAGTFMILLHAWFKKKPEEGVKTETPTGEQI
ncbi:signal peptidase II [Mucilaginibacter gotjawali]|nr:signal peptidase II [Mucilaginibacter gotjawali]MBB3058638.1 signal peptidase II [Mucilaginibacter gotjawali]